MSWGESIHFEGARKGRNEGLIVWQVLAMHKRMTGLKIVDL